MQLLDLLLGAVYIANVMSKGAGKSGKDDTKERIMLAAESLFAERGFESVSLRDITTEALANVAAVNYYFGTKDALIDELITQGNAPLLSARMKLLDAAEKKYQIGIVPVEVVLDAVMRPMLMQIEDHGDRRDIYCKFMGRCMTERGTNLPKPVILGAQRLIKRMIGLLTDALPEDEPEVLIWKIHFSFGVLGHTLMHDELLRSITKGASEEPDFEVTLQRMIDFCKGGLNAGSSEVAQSSGNQGVFLF